MFRRFFDEGLAQASYLIACDRTRQAAVVDPRRDIDVYLAAARDAGLTLACAIETHVHADFVSGGRELAALGATVVAGPGAALAFPHDEIRDGERRMLGDIELTFLHTPGHTPEHLSLIVREPGQIARVLTGDTLFVGSVGRPDLLGADAARELADHLYESLFSRLLTLPDETIIYPGHGAGSLCGAGIGDAPSSSIGSERLTNPWLQHRTRDAFTAAVLTDLPETPPYFARMKRVNQQGPAVLSLGEGVPPPPALAAADAAGAVAAGAVLVDLRSAAEFGAGHPAGALHLALGPNLSYWGGWLLPFDAPLLLLGHGSAQEAAEARRLVLRVGLDNVAGFVDGGHAAWQAAGLPMASIEQLGADDLGRRQAAGLVTIVDVRSPREWRAGHIPGALNLPLGALAERLAEVPRGLPVATICEGGYRSSLAASLLDRLGVTPVLNVPGGMRAWRDGEPARPLVREHDAPRRLDVTPA